MDMDWIWKAIVVFAIVALLDQVMRKSNKRRLPPGPKGLPILGHLHLLGKNPHQDLHELAKKHGPIVYMRFGLAPTIVVSSPQAAEQFLKTYDPVMASRPRTEFSKYIGYNNRGFVFGPYGPYWRNMPKLCTLEFLSNSKINSFRPMRREEIGLLVDTIKKAAQEGIAVDLSSKVSSLSADMGCRMLFGKKYTDEDFGGRGFKAVMQEAMKLVAAPNLGDFFPFLSILDIQGLTRQMKAISKVFDAFMEKIIEEHEQRRNQGEMKDFVDTILGIMESGEAEFRLDRGNVKAILLDMLAASMDTSAAVIEWTMSELLRHPHVLKKVQKELEEVVGMNRMVEESDLDSLEYLYTVVKESLRLHPVAPLLIPHESMDDCTIDGFHIPKKSRIIINVQTIGRDPNAWSDPEEFIPERFIGNNIDIKGRDFQLIPFGSGRRSCPGIQLGLTVVRLVIAQLVHCFDWKLPHDMMPTDLDMSEHSGLVVSRAEHLKAFPSYRLQK